jgi:tight adherence protein B
MEIAAGVFVLVLSIIVGSYWLFVARGEKQEGRALYRRMTVRRATAPLSATVVKARERLSSFGALEGLLTRWGSLTDPLRESISRAGLRATVGTIILACVFLAVVAFGVTLFLTSSRIAAAAAGGVASVLPLFFVRRKAAKRMALFEEQFPEAIDLMARAMRAGHALPTALQMVGDEIQDPIGAEFKLLFDQQNYGMSLPDALRAFAERLPLLDARFFVTAVLTQREMGGNLSEVLDNLAAVIRERFKVKRQVKVISAHGRITGVVLACLPPSVAAVLFIISPDHIRILIEDPLGVYMVALGITLQLVGVVWIKRVINIEY